MSRLNDPGNSQDGSPVSARIAVRRLRAESSRRLVDREFDERTVSREIGVVAVKGNSRGFRSRTQLVRGVDAL